MLRRIARIVLGGKPVDIELKAHGEKPPSEADKEFVQRYTISPMPIPPGAFNNAVLVVNADGKLEWTASKED